MERLALTALCALTVCLSTVYGQDCSSAQFCDTCVQRNSSCGWCTSPLPQVSGVRAARCQTVGAHIQSRNCLMENIVSPQSAVREPTPSGVSTESGRKLVDLTQGQSGEITLDMRAGDTATFDVKVVRNSNFPVDLYYIMDTTGTMAFNLGNLRSNGPTIIQQLGSLTSTRRIGLGTFSDKPTAPYFNQYHNGSLYQKDPGVRCGATAQTGIRTTCGSPNSFTHLLRLTNNVSEFTAAVSKVKLVQKAEADIERKSQLEALLQASICQDDIDWSAYVRGTSIRLIILATDGKYHSAGDGILAGILSKNGGKCNLNMLTGESQGSTMQDYPSTGQVKAALDENEVLVMFAVATAQGLTDVSPFYENLVRQWAGRAFTSKLNPTDDSGFVALVVNATRLASEQASVRLAGINRDGLVMSVNATCPSGSPVNPGEANERCDMMKISREATFQVSLTAADCGRLTAAKDLQLFISPAYGIVNISINALCSCPCTDTALVNSSSCSSLGNFTCGQCDCPENKRGAQCQCDLAQVNMNSNRLTNCRPSNSADSVPECNGQGRCDVLDSCEYGCLECDPGFHGKYCQCRDTLCNVASNGQPCGGLGQGRCQCDPLTCGNCRCTCLEPFTLDEVCNECKLCRTTDNTAICSSNGVCRCGICNCTGGWTGATCSACSAGQQCISAVCGRAAPCIDAPDTCLNGDSCYLCMGASRVSTTMSGIGCVKHYCPSTTLLDTSPGSTYRFDDPLNPPSNVTIGDLCSLNDGRCQRTFYSAVNSQGQLVGLAVVRINEAQDCSQPVDTLPIVLGIVLGLVGLAILILVVWKIVTFFLDRREYRRFLEAQKDAKWEKESNPLFKSPTQTFVNPDYKGQKSH